MYIIVFWLRWITVVFFHSWTEKWILVSEHPASLSCEFWVQFVDSNLDIKKRILIICLINYNIICLTLVLKKFFCFCLEVSKVFSCFYDRWFNKCIKLWINIYPIFSALVLLTLPHVFIAKALLKYTSAVSV